MTRALVPALLGALWLVAASAEAQPCTVRGEQVTIRALHLRPDLIAWDATVDLEVTLELAGGAVRAPVPIRVRSPIDAPATAWVHFGVRDASGLDPAFFRLDAPEAVERVRVVRSPGGARIVVGRYAVSGASPQCVSLRIVGGDPEEIAEMPVASGPGAFHGPLRVHVAPSAASRSVEVGPSQEQDSLPVRASIVETRGEWVRLDIPLGGGVRVAGWALASSLRDGAADGGFVATHGGLRPRRGTAVSDADCFVGPAFFAPRARLYRQEDSRDPFGVVVDGERMIVRDCGRERVEIIEALGQELALGWVQRASLARVGAMRCGDLTLAQDPRTLRVTVIASTRDDVAAGDEILRAGAVTTPYPPDAPVSLGRLDEVCGVYQTRAPFVVEGATGRREICAR